MSMRLRALLPIVIASIAAAAPQDEESKKPDSGDWGVFDVKNTALLALALPEIEPAVAETRGEASELSRIVFDDISFASAFKILDPENYALARKAADGDDDYGWSSIGADIVVTRVVSKHRGDLVVQIQIRAIQEKKTLFETQYAGSATTRELAHHISDSILQKFGMVGIARSKIAFASDRKTSAGGNKSLFVTDYDGYDQRRGTRNHHLDLQPRFSPDGSTMSFISYPKRTNRRSSPS